MVLEILNQLLILALGTSERLTAVRRGGHVDTVTVIR